MTKWIIVPLIFVSLLVSCAPHKPEIFHQEITVEWSEYSSHGDVDTTFVHLEDGTVIKLNNLIFFEQGKTYELWIREIQGLQKYEVISLKRR